MKLKDYSNLKEMLIDFNEYSTDYTKTRCRELEETIKNTLKEIERLNNIINELEHKLYQEWLEWKDSDCESIYVRAFEDKAIYDYIQELKGSDSNE